jgi:pSer/pThr/pTyr-binding forkhead associated (FHA) protein
LGKSEITIGRDPSNDIVINEAEVSRKHARLFFQDETYLLEDLGSTNGTFVNGQRLTSPQNLQLGASILLGENISITYEPIQQEADGTVAVRPRQVEPQAAPPPPQYHAPRQEREAPQAPPSYSGYVPPGPVFAEAPGIPAETQKAFGPRSWLYAGCGCLVVVILLLAIGGYAFDQLDMWCVPPFDALGRYLPLISYTCP